VKRLAVALVAALVSRWCPHWRAQHKPLRAPPSCTRLVVGTRRTVEGADGAGYLTILFANDRAGFDLREPQRLSLGSILRAHATRLRGPTSIAPRWSSWNSHHAGSSSSTGQVAVGRVTWSDDPKSHQTCSTTQWANVVTAGPTRQIINPRRTPRRAVRRYG